MVRSVVRTFASVFSFTPVAPLFSNSWPSRTTVLMSSRKVSRSTLCPLPALCRIREANPALPEKEIGIRTHLKNRKGVRCKRFEPAARREEVEYPLWIFDRGATPQQLQRSATLRAEFWRAAGVVAPRSQ